MTMDMQPGPPGSGPYWIKSSFSFANGNCVEVAALSDGKTGVRDSRDPEGPVLEFAPGAWRAFLGWARTGRQPHP